MMNQGKRLFFYCRGIWSGEKVYIGPHTVSLYLTQSCNHSCAYCSPYKEYSRGTEKRSAKEWIKRLRTLIPELSRNGVQKIVLSGGGEPFLFPYVEEVLTMIKSQGLQCAVITNGTLIDERIAAYIIKLNIEEIYISVGAGDEKTYRNIHGADADFSALKRALTFLRRVRLKKRPSIKAVHVLTRENIENVEDMLSFTAQNFDECLFTIFFSYADVKSNFPTAEQVDALRLRRRQLKKMYSVKNNVDWIINRLVYEVARAPEFLKPGAHDDLPCYIGWVYTIINAQGDVIPCCGRPGRAGIGNIYEAGFKDIWRSPGYDGFRQESISARRSQAWQNRYCSHYCMNWRFNEKINFVLHPLRQYRALNL
jgi:radical SAM protein with 4Fe4S-binding SPASM domain